MKKEIAKVLAPCSESQ